MSCPQGYGWHLITEREARCLRDIRHRVNTTLQAISGIPLGGGEYMLHDDRLRSGYVRYAALLSYHCKKEFLGELLF